MVQLCVCSCNTTTERVGVFVIALVLLVVVVLSVMVVDVGCDIFCSCPPTDDLLKDYFDNGCVVSQLDEGNPGILFLCAT